MIRCIRLYRVTPRRLPYTCPYSLFFFLFLVSTIFSFFSLYFSFFVLPVTWIASKYARVRTIYTCVHAGIVQWIESRRHAIVIRWYLIICVTIVIVIFIWQLTPLLSLDFYVTTVFLLQRTFWVKRDKWL